MNIIDTNKDYATGKPVNLSQPEELVRQDTEKWIVGVLGYEKNKLDIERRIRGGHKWYKPDIIILRNDRNSNPLNQHQDILGLVETKSNSIDEAEAQLHSYMAVCSRCEWGIAATADARHFYRRKPDGEPERIYRIPPYGVSIDQSLRLKKSDLKPAVNLKLHFKSILNHLHSNSELQSRSRLCNEMTKILFCKIYDERLENDTPYFQILDDKSPFEIKQNIETQLWGHVLKDLEITEIYPTEEGIILTQVAS